MEKRKNMEYLFEKISILDPIDGEKRNMYVGVDHAGICWISDTAPLEPAKRVIPGRNRLLIPGLKNTHTHIAMTALRGVCDDRNLNDWLFGSIIPLESRMTPRMIELSAQMGLLEAAAGGTTAVCDMYACAPQLARSVRALGMRGNIGNVPLCTQDFSPDDRSILETEQLLAEFSADTLITPVCGVHSVHTTCPQVWEWVGKLVARRPVPLIMHMSEAREDVEACRKLYGDTPAAVLEANGLFACRPLIAHGVWVDERELEILARNDVSLAHCPVSNLKLASGIAPVTDYLAHGINVSIATDGVASNNSLDLFEEMKYAVLLQKYRKGDAQALDSAQVFRFATVNACKALGYGNCGRIAQGYDADLVMLDLDRPGLVPQRDLLSNLIYCANASDVRLTMVRGRIIYENGAYPNIDHERIIREFCDDVMPLLHS